MPPIVTRFAPSPTGHLHVGGARSALFCWAFAQRAKLDGKDGRFMIRIEDTDQARSSDESARGILEDLAWLGIAWDDGPVFTPPPAAHAKDAGTSKVGGDPRHVGPFFQAQRKDIYDRYIEQLITAGRAYPAFETPEQLETMRKAAAAEKRTFRYDRSVMPIGERLRRRQMGEPHVVRFLAPAEPIVVHDQVLGDVSYAAGEMDDFVIRKADGFPIYHFAVVIDDELMGVTHIMRAQEHLNNTPRHVALQRALVRHEKDAAEGTPAGTPFRTPVYAHMPLIFNMDGAKMSKRDKARTARKVVKEALAMPGGWSVINPPANSGAGGEPAPEPAAELGVDGATFWAFVEAENDSLEIAEAIARYFKIALPEVEVSDYRASGYLPEAIVNFLGLLGWSPGKDEQGKDIEKFGMEFLAKNFTIDRIGRTNAKFDRVKLLAFNADYLAALPDDQFAARWRAWCAEFAPEAHARIDAAAMLLLAPAIKPRAKTFRDALTAVRFALITDDGYDFDPKAVEKVLKKPAKPGEPTGLEMLKETRATLEALEPFTPEAIQSALEALAAGKGAGLGSIAQPLRVALTGNTVSPPLGPTLAVLGKASTLGRISRCLAATGG